MSERHTIVVATSVAQGVGDRTSYKGLACIWLDEATDEDVNGAAAWAEKNGWTVYLFDVDDPDALEKARLSEMSKRLRKEPNGA
jgi:hypothetical protein